MLTKLQNSLKAKLYDIWDDREFVMGVGCTLSGDKEVQQMIDYVDSGEWDIPSDITVKALFIAKDRQE